jgi:hypothetical protein
MAAKGRARYAPIASTTTLAAAAAFTAASSSAATVAATSYAAAAAAAALSAPAAAAACGALGSIGGALAAPPLATLGGLVARRARSFVAVTSLARRAIVALDIPLLFEGNSQDMFDAVAVITAPAFMQRQRALARPGMTPKRLDAMLARQWPDSRKRRHADAVISSSLGKRETLRRLKQLLRVVSCVK